MGAGALWESLRISYRARSETEDRANGFSEEMGVTAAAAQTPCPDILGPVQQFAPEVEDLPSPTTG